MAYRPLDSMHGSAWVTARAKAGLGGLHVHDLHHTVGMRLREAGVDEATRADVLWHTRAGMTAHHSATQVRELKEALERITSESQRVNVSLRMLSQGRAGVEVPRKPPGKEKGPRSFRC